MNLSRQTPKPAILWPPRGHERGGLARKTQATSLDCLWPPARGELAYVAAYLARREAGHLSGVIVAASLAATWSPQRFAPAPPGCSNRLFRQTGPFSSRFSVCRSVGA